MRLTLRTLLAYLDDILEPDDTEEIAKKVGESEFATNLVHRTRECVRRLRLGAPPLVGRGLGTDPNSVAEYLDNTLAPDRVGEFEKVCLESDVHLAEVAACHQVLTLVLGESADIPPDARERMYQLAAHVDAPPVQEDAARAAGVATLLPSPARRAKLEVPEYLRETRSRLWPLAALVLLGAVLTFAGLAVFGPAPLRERLTAFGQASPAEAEPTADAQPTESTPTATEPAVEPVAEAVAPPAEAAAPAEIPADKPAVEQPVEAPVQEAVPDEPAAIVPQETRQADDVTAPTAPEPQDATAAANGGKPSAAGVTNVAGRPLPIHPAPLRPTPAEPRAGLPPLAGEPSTDGGPPEARIVPSKPLGDDEPADGGSRTLGSYTSKHDVLLRFSPAGSDWTRLAANATLNKGDRLLALPLFRPAMTLGDITIQTDGAAQLELTGSNGEGAPIVAVEFGRLLMRSAKPTSSVEIKLEDHTVVVSFIDAEATVALDVARVLSPGRDPEANRAQQAADLYVTSGQIRVRVDDAAPTDLQAPVHQALAGSRPNRANDNEFPKWVTAEAPSDLERGATTTLEPLLVADRPVALSLGELSNHRRREVRSLAIRSNANLGNFEACIEALNDKDEKSLWPTYIDELRTALTRNADTAGRVKAALEKQRAPDAAGLFRMLWGYNLDDLKNGADADLVEGLNHDSLDYRVLAFWNLQNVTGLPSFGYHPSDAAKARSSAVRSWKDKLKQGKIVPRAASAPGKPKGSTRAADKGSS